MKSFLWCLSLVPGTFGKETNDLSQELKSESTFLLIYEKKKKKKINRPKAVFRGT